MDAQQFLAEFGHIANAPGGVARLRELVLQLAIQGKLVGSPEVVRSSSDLLHRVRRARAQLVADKKLPREKPYPNVSVDEGVVRGARHWRWAYFGEVWHLLSGRDLGPTQYNESRTGIPYITGASNIENGVIAVNRWTPEPVVISTTGDLLITCKGTIGKTAFNNIGAVHIARQIMAIRGFSDELDSQFLKIWLDGFVDELIKKSKSMIPGFSRDDLIFATYPIFPLEEQTRIVAKVSELMALCDRLEKQQQDRRKLQNGLRQSTLQALAGAESPHELQESWQRLQGTFGHLFSEPADVKTLRASVLDLALVGYLSQRMPDDESVDAFLGRTRDAKALRLASGELKRKVGAATDVVQLDVDIPAHWSKATLEELFQFIDYRGKTPTKTESGVVLVTAKNVRPGRLDREPVEYISESSYAEWMTRGFPKKGDLLFTTEAPLGNVALIEEPPTFALAQRVINLQPFADLNTRCAMYFMLSPRFQSLLDKNSSGMTAKGIKAAKLKQLEIPVPPVAEQARIVSRVEQLMRICDRFEKELLDGNKAAERLAIASTAELAGVAIEQLEEAAVKAPQTDLIAPLRLGTLPGVKDQAPLATLLARQQGEMSARDLWQRFGGEIDAFYAQLKTEVAHGWITEPTVAEVRTKTAETAGG